MFVYLAIVIIAQFLYGCWVGIQPVQSQTRGELSNLQINYELRPPPPPHHQDSNPKWKPGTIHIVCFS